MMLFVVATLLFGAGAVVGAELQDRILEDQRRRLVKQRQQVNEAIRALRMSRDPDHAVILVRPIPGVSAYRADNDAGF